MKEKILIADDEESIRFTFSEFLDGAGYQVTTTESLSDCIKKMQTEAYDLLFLDIGFGVDNGIEAIEGIKVLQPDCSVVIITGVPDSKTILKARKNGAVDYLAKPIREASLLYITRKVLQESPAKRNDTVSDRH
jgi:DNA-binding NtrC family response regulator